MTVFGFVYLLSCVAFVFTDVLSLLALEVYTTFELAHCLRVCSLPKTNLGNQMVSLLSQCQNRSLRKGAKLELCRVLGGGIPKMELEGRSKNGTQKGEEDEMKRIQKWSRKCRVILMVVTKIFPTRSLLRTSN